MKTFDLLKESLTEVPEDIQKKVSLSFGIVDRIHEILERQGKTQKDLAKALGKNESEISKWMRGTHNFTIDTLSKISAALGEEIINVIEVQRQSNFSAMLELSTYKYLFQRNDNAQHRSFTDNDTGYIIPMNRLGHCDVNRRIN